MPALCAVCVGLCVTRRPRRPSSRCRRSTTITITIITVRLSSRRRRRRAACLRRRPPLSSARRRRRRPDTRSAAYSASRYRLWPRCRCRRQAAAARPPSVQPGPVPTDCRPAPPRPTSEFATITTVRFIIRTSYFITRSIVDSLERRRLTASSAAWTNIGDRLFTVSSATDTLTLTHHFKLVAISAPPYILRSRPIITTACLKKTVAYLIFYNLMILK